MRKTGLSKKFSFLSSIVTSLFLSPFAITSIYAQQGIDVTLKIDESGSMGGSINAVKNNVLTIFNNLPSGSHVGLVGYGTNLTTPPHGTQHGIPHVHTPLTNDRTTFQNAVNELVASGGLEPGYDTIYGTAKDALEKSLNFRGKPYCAILITDEPSNGDQKTAADAITALKERKGIFFGVAALGAPTDSYKGIADATGGQMFDLQAFVSDPANLITAILGACKEAVGQVAVDVKPPSCPNPFNMKKTGVTPVAILGSSDVDITQIDVSSIRLEKECAPLRSSHEDVAAPYTGEISDPPLETECANTAPDGFIDLVLHFDNECLASTQGTVTGKKAVIWTITGKKTDGSPIQGRDVVRLMP
ncbi:MAG: VWA domain-containing protein [Oligoflexales bacterium]|nr:VWA domain-containing protein [Oligoflexales bacterium]